MGGNIRSATCISDADFCLVWNLFGCMHLFPNLAKNWKTKSNHSTLPFISFSNINILTLEACFLLPLILTLKEETDGGVEKGNFVLKEFLLNLKLSVEAAKDLLLTVTRRTLLLKNWFWISFKQWLKAAKECWNPKRNWEHWLNPFSLAQIYLKYLKKDQNGGWILSS